jgi:biopolymer transport protein ExbD
MAKKGVPGLNTSSMADISFLLLTFFLLTSSINTDQGIQRRLPPPVQKEEKIEVKKRNVLNILVNMYDQLLVNGEVVQNPKFLKDRVKEFILNRNEDPDMPEKQSKYIPELGRNEVVSKGVVSLQNDRSTSYQIYIVIQDQLTQAFNELRNEYAMTHFGKSFENLIDNDKSGVQAVFPISVSEAEPSNYGGGK